MIELNFLSFEVRLQEIRDWKLLSLKWQIIWSSNQSANLLLYCGENEVRCQVTFSNLLIIIFEHVSEVYNFVFWRSVFRPINSYFCVSELYL